MPSRQHSNSLCPSFMVLWLHLELVLNMPWLFPAISFDSCQAIGSYLCLLFSQPSCKVMFEPDLNLKKKKKFLPTTAASNPSPHLNSYSSHNLQLSSDSVQLCPFSSIKGRAISLASLLSSSPNSTHTRSPTQYL